MANYRGTIFKAMLCHSVKSHFKFLGLVEKGILSAKRRCLLLVCTLLKKAGTALCVDKNMHTQHGFFTVLLVNTGLYVK